MKKFIVFLVLASSFMMASCSQYTCPTYAKATPDKKIVSTNRQL